MTDFNITAVVGVTSNLELFRKFYKSLRDVTEVPVVICALQLDESTLGELLQIVDGDVNVSVVRGKPVDGHSVSFSENYNAGINAVKTDKLVLIHTDMCFTPTFFSNLDKNIQEKRFTTYITVEPPLYVGHRRPGKIIGDFGSDFEDFDSEGFYDYAQSLEKDHQSIPGYGFFQAGYKKDFEAVGGFDFLTFNPVFCEDDDFMVRLRILGYHTYLDYSAVCYHFVSKSSREVVGAGMTRQELESNKNFSRKWGFEVRCLWVTGYEGVEQPLEVFERPITMVTDSVEYANLLEPLINSIILQEGDQSGLSDISRKKLTSRDFRENILIEINSSFPRDRWLDLTNLLGQFRLCSGILQPGEYDLFEGRVRISIGNKGDLKKREDSRNYLFLQKNIEYE